MTREEALKIAKPILFNTRMVREIQDGTKTVTRRLVKPKYTNTEIVLKNGKAFETAGTPATTVEIKSPFAVGDILYVRETWFYEGAWHDLTAGKPDLPSGKYLHRYVYKAESPDYPVDIGAEGWCPSIHMPKEAARIFLRVTDVRVERVHNITNEQAIHEGIEPHMILLNSAGTITKYRIPGTHDEYPTAWGAFSHLWNSTVKKSDLPKYGWNANPGVWVIEFERLEMTK